MIDSQVAQTNKIEEIEQQKFERFDANLEAALERMPRYEFRDWDSSVEYLSSIGFQFYQTAGDDTRARYVADEKAIEDDLKLVVDVAKRCMLYRVSDFIKWFDRTMAKRLAQNGLTMQTFAKRYREFENQKQKWPSKSDILMVIANPRICIKGISKPAHIVYGKKGQAPRQAEKLCQMLREE